MSRPSLTAINFFLFILQGLLIVKPTLQNYRGAENLKAFSKRVDFKVVVYEV